MWRPLRRRPRQVAYREAVDQNEQVGRRDRNGYFNRKDVIQQVGDDWISVGKADAREGNELSKQTLGAGQS